MKVMDERPLARVLVLQEQWEVEHPVELVPRLVDEAELLAEVETQGAEHPLDHRRAVRDEGTVEPGGARNASSSPSVRNFAIGERTSRLSSYTRYASPFAPHSFAKSSSFCSSPRENDLGATR